MNKLGYYPGCSMHATCKEYEISAKKILQNFDIELEEIKDWNCCGAADASAMDHFLSVALPARNLAIANHQYDELIMLCSACQQVHNKTKQKLIENPLLKQEIEKSIGKEINTDIGIKHLLSFISNEIETGKIEANVKKSLNGLKVAPYYGCAINRPSSYIHGEDPEFPVSLEKIITALGGEALQFSYRTKCCGGVLLLPEEDFALAISKNILLEAKKNSADCLAVVCPLCQATLEIFSLKMKLEMPILFFTQLMGIAFGYTIKELGLNHNLISAEKMLKKYGYKK